MVAYMSGIQSQSIDQYQLNLPNNCLTLAIIVTSLMAFTFYLFVGLVTSQVKQQMLFICIVTFECLTIVGFSRSLYHGYDLIIYLQASWVSSLHLLEIESFFDIFLIYGTYEFDIMFSFCPIENCYVKRSYLLEMLSFCPHDQLCTRDQSSTMWCHHVLLIICNAFNI